MTRVTPQRDSTLPHYLLDVVALKIDRARDARREAELCVASFDRMADALANAVANGNRHAQLFVGRLDVLRSQLHASTDNAPLLDATKAAARLGLLRPDGTPRDSAYAAIKKAGGVKVAGKWVIAEDQLHAHLRRKELR
jgi:hypothetical protein